MGKTVAGLLGLRPEKPREDPELKRRREELEAQMAKEKAEQKRKKEDRLNRYRTNMIGSKSLKDEEMEGMTGFKTTKLMSGKTGYNKSLNSM